MCCKSAWSAATTRSTPGYCWVACRVLTRTALPDGRRVHRDGLQGGREAAHRVADAARGRVGEERKQMMLYKSSTGMLFCGTRESRMSLGSSPSMAMTGCASAACMTKWLSQCGQYSSASSSCCLHRRLEGQRRESAHVRSFLKTFLHFLQATISSTVLKSSWSLLSSWHLVQSNHRLQHAARIDASLSLPVSHTAVPAH